MCLPLETSYFDHVNFILGIADSGIFIALLDLFQDLSEYSWKHNARIITISLTENARQRRFRYFTFTSDETILEVGFILLAWSGPSGKEDTSLRKRSDNSLS